MENAKKLHPVDPPPKPTIDIQQAALLHRDIRKLRADAIRCGMKDTSRTLKEASDVLEGEAPAAIHPETVDDVRALPIEFHRSGLLEVLGALDTSEIYEDDEPEFYCTDFWNDLVCTATDHQIRQVIADTLIQAPQELMEWLEANVKDD